MFFSGATYIVKNLGGFEKAVTTKKGPTTEGHDHEKGPNDASSIVWASGTCFLFFISVFSILTNNFR